jgi:hypothetical protein
MCVCVCVLYRLVMGTLSPHGSTRRGHQDVRSWATKTTTTTTTHTHTHSLVFLVPHWRACFACSSLRFLPLAMGIGEAGEGNAG